VRSGAAKPGRVSNHAQRRCKAFLPSLLVKPATLRTLVMDSASLHLYAAADAVALRASGRAGSRQTKDANVSFVGARAPIVTGTTFIFVGDPY
jgi:hypothetical protein